MSQSINIGLFDHSPAIRTGLKHILSSDPKFTNIVEIETHEEIISKLANLDLDVLMLDVETSHSVELDLLKQYRQLKPDVKLVIFTACSDCQKIMDIIKIGISGFKLKSAQPDEILRCMHTVIDGGADVDSQISNALMDYIAHKQNDKLSELSNREEQVLDLMARGQSNNDIADKLCITPRTVKYHVSSIFTKLKVKNRTEAAAKWVVH